MRRGGCSSSPPPQWDQRCMKFTPPPEMRGMRGWDTYDKLWRGMCVKSSIQCLFVQVCKCQGFYLDSGACMCARLMCVSGFVTHSLTYWSTWQLSWGRGGGGAKCWDRGGQASGGSESSEDHQVPRWKHICLHIHEHCEHTISVWVNGVYRFYIIYFNFI